LGYTNLTDAIQPSKDPLEVPIGPVTRLRAKKFKEAFNELLQRTIMVWLVFIGYLLKTLVR
jgi:hypothetical protein